MLTGADVRAEGRWQLDRDPHLLETSVPGIFACGDVRFSPVKRVASAVGEGSMAIAFVHQYLNETRGPAEAGPPERDVRLLRLGRGDGQCCGRVERPAEEHEAQR